MALARRLVATVAAGFVVAWGLACPAAKGGVHVVVSGQLRAGEDFDQLELRVERGQAGGELLESARLEGGELGELPVSFNLVSGEAVPAGAVLWVVATALKSGVPVASAAASVTLQTGEGAAVELVLTAPGGQDAGEDAGAQDAGAQDAGADGGVLDAGADDGGDPLADGGPVDAGPRLHLVSATPIDHVRVRLEFDLPLEPSAAQSVSNYSVPGLTVASATVLSGNTTVELRTSFMEAETSYSLTVTNLSAQDATPLEAPCVANFQLTGALAGLVGHWPFEEGSGTSTADRSGNQNTGYLRDSADGGPVWAAGRVGGALSFDGVDDAVRVPDSQSITSVSQGITIAAWVYWTDLGTTAVLEAIAWRQLGTAATDQYGLCVPAGTSELDFVINFGAGNRVAYTSIAANQWTHVVALFDGAYQQIWVNGAQRYSSPKSGTLAPTSNPFTIGGAENGTSENTSESFQGLIDEVRLYSRGLSADEISALYAAAP